MKRKMCLVLTVIMFGTMINPWQVMASTEKEIDEVTESLAQTAEPETEVATDQDVQGLASIEPADIETTPSGEPVTPSTTPAVTVTPEVTALPEGTLTDGEAVAAASAIQTGWQKVGNDFYYYDNGVMFKGGWKKLDGYYRYFLTDGKMFVNGWRKIDGYYRYFNEWGCMLTSRWAKIDGYYRYLNEWGCMLTNCWAKIDGYYRYLNEWGCMLTNQFVKIDGYYRYLNEWGCMMTGWQKIDGYYRYFNGWGCMMTGWQRIDGYYRYFNQWGCMLTGWQKIDGYYRYLNEWGCMLTGHVYIGGFEYTLNESGCMLSDGIWVKGEDVGKTSGKWYYFKLDGSYAQDEWIGNAGVGGQYVTKDGTKFYKNSGGQAQISLSTETVYNVGDPKKGYIYYFDGNGICTGQSDRYVYHTDPADGRKYRLEAQFDTDPKVSDEDFLTAALYTEAGDQGEAGMMMCGYVMMNRLANSGYPGTLTYLIYQDGYFEVARDGSLTRILTMLKNGQTNKYIEAARSAARKVLAGADIVTDDGKTIKRSDFTYMYFMTPESFDRLGLSYTKCEIYHYNGHIYFKNYIKA